MLEKLNELTESHGELRRGKGLMSGVIALSLGVLCFLGVLAFHFPEYLTTPELRKSYNVDVKPFENFSVGISGKFIGDRFTNLTNTEKFNGYALWDMYARYKVEAFNAKDTYLQLNVKNLFDERYLGNIVTNITGTGQGEPGYGRSVIATLHVEF